MDATDSKSAGAGTPLTVAGRKVELRLVAINAKMLRITLLPVAADGDVEPLRVSSELIVDEPGQSIARLRSLAETRELAWETNRIQVSANPLSVRVIDSSERIRQIVHINDDQTIGFSLGDAPIFGLGQGGRQFDRRGGTFPRVNGQGEGDRSIDMNAAGARAPVAMFDLAGEGARITIPWIISAEGWAIYFHRPTGTFDLSGEQGLLLAGSDGAAPSFDAFLVLSNDPAEIMRQYALLTGHPHLPPLWSLGYLQSHRTLAGRDEVLAEAKTFRERGLPCDGMIYLGTGFCPDGWNTGHGSFAFNPRIFPDPEEMIRRLHDDGMRVVLHVVDPPVSLHGAVGEWGAKTEKEDHAAHYWKLHEPAMTIGVDGWWPDVGDSLDPDARLARIGMYWDGALKSRPDQRPFALHRNAYAGVQRHGWLWSGDIDSAWRTLAMQIPVGLNCGLTGIPYWGTDTGGFITTPELTGELFVRWFQYSAFCPSFRGHGRTWKLRLPWGWNTGEYGPEEFDFRRVALPDRSELRNAAVEPICKTYLELRYQLLPYTYSAVRETAETGMPVMRALWLHYPDDPVASGCGDAYLWGRDILVAPVTEKGATSRALYLPEGDWFDFWTGERIAGGRNITRAIDLATLPLYVRAGAIIPTGPVKQSTGEVSDEPLSLTIYPGCDGVATLYEDDGESLAHQRGDWRAFQITWNDKRRSIGVSLAPGSRPLAAPRAFVTTLRNSNISTNVVFNGEPLEARL